MGRETWLVPGALSSFISIKGVYYLCSKATTDNLINGASI